MTWSPDEPAWHLGATASGIPDEGAPSGDFVPPPPPAAKPPERPFPHRAAAEPGREQTAAAAPAPVLLAPAPQPVGKRPLPPVPEAIQRSQLQRPPALPPAPKQTPKSALQAVAEMRERKKARGELPMTPEKKSEEPQPRPPEAKAPPREEEALNPEAAAAAVAPKPAAASEQESGVRSRPKNGTRLRDLQTIHPERSPETSERSVAWFAVRCCAAYFTFRFGAVMYQLYNEGGYEALW